MTPFRPMNGTDTPTTNKRTASPYNQNTTTGPFAERGGPHTSGRAGASPSGGVADGSVHRSFLSPGTVRGLQAAEYDPDWPSEEELRAKAPRYTRREQLRDGALFLVCMAALALLAALGGGCELDDASRAPAAAPTTTTTTTTTRPAASAPAPALVFRYGGVDGSKAKEDPRCRISKLGIGNDSLSFHWDTGIPADWSKGATGKGMMILACAFYEENGRWVGGKFDWIDEARASRPLENIHTGYGGWNAAAWAAAKRRAFCVMSADGKKRSNLLEETR